MAIKFAEAGHRDIKAMSNLSDGVRKALNEAFDAISTWRTEALSNSEKNSGYVIEKMAAAARALGWPEQIVDATREQLQNITKMQIESLDRMMEVWEACSILVAPATIRCSTSSRLSEETMLLDTSKMSSSSLILCLSALFSMVRR